MPSCYRVAVLMLSYLAGVIDMTRLERVIHLIERYDGLAAAGVESHKDSELGKLMLKELREEAKQLKQELIDHGCRRLN